MFQRPSLVGQQFGAYRLLRLLGSGGFADVYLGEHIHLGTQAAIKVLHEQLNPADMAAFHAAFRNEARIIARLAHAHIVTILDYNIEGTTPFLVMRYAVGGTMRQHYPRGTIVPLTSIVSYVQQIASALQYTHDQNYIHRDIKPENILLDQHHNALLSDFGIVAIHHSAPTRETTDMAGTPIYMAPEQSTGKPQLASDQYSLGIVVYEWLCGTPPFMGSAIQLLSHHLFVSPPPLRDKVSTISPEVERVVMQALEKDPKKRFSSVHAFADALQQASQAGKSPPPASQPGQQQTIAVPSITQKNPSSHRETHPPDEPPNATLRVTEDPLNDFFISYSRGDLSWAKWIKWQLDKAGYTTVLRPWSIRSDSDFEMEIREAAIHAKRIILVLSPNYLNTFITQDTFANIFKQKTTEETDKLLPICIQECGYEFRKLLDSINHIDLSEEDEITASAMLLAAVHGKGFELTIQPIFPGNAGNKAPTFPGKGHIPPSPSAPTNNARISSAPAIAKSQFEYFPTPQIFPAKTLKVFLSYSHYDKAMRVKLEKYLRHLKRQYSFITWHDGEIGAGNEWAKEIDMHLSQANIVLLLVSQDFIASDYCYNIEMMRSLERHRQGEACVIPIILKPAHWEVTPLHELQALPTGGKAITLWSNRDAAFLDVARGVQKVVDGLIGNNPSG